MKKRVEREIGFVLHSWPYRETSLVVECFCRQYGRVGLIAKGAKRPYSTFRGLLQSFRPLNLSWGGTHDLKTLHQIEIVSAHKMPVGLNWLCGCYVNELIIKLLARHDPHPDLFDHYHEMVLALSALSGDENHSDRTAHESLLRSFEKALLREIGYAVNLTVDRTDTPIEPTAYYRLDPTGSAIEPANGATDEAVVFLGQSLIDIDRDDYSSPTTRSNAKRLMRQLISHCLAGGELRTRRLLIDLQDF